MLISSNKQKGNFVLSILTIPIIGAKNIKAAPMINNVIPVCIWDAPNFLCTKGAIMDSTKPHPAQHMNVSMYGIHIVGY